MKLNKDDVMHVASLAKLSVSVSEIDKYTKQLEDILTEIDKINKVDVTTDNILITPNKQTNIYNDDVYQELLTKEEIFKNSKNHNQEYIIVPKVIE